MRLKRQTRYLSCQKLVIRTNLTHKCTETTTPLTSELGGGLLQEIDFIPPQCPSNNDLQLNKPRAYLAQRVKLSAQSETASSRRVRRPKAYGPRGFYQGPYIRPSHQKGPEGDGIQDTQEGKPIRGEERATTKGTHTSQIQGLSHSFTPNRFVSFPALFQLRLVSLISCHSCNPF